MENVRCLLAGIPHNLLTDIIQNLAEGNRDFEVVGCIENKEKLPNLVSDRNVNVNVVILGMGNDSLPNECEKLFAKSSSLVVVGIEEDGRRATVFMDDIGPSELMDIVQATFSERKKRR